MRRTTDRPGLVRAIDLEPGIETRYRPLWRMRDDAGRRIRICARHLGCAASACPHPVNGQPHGQMHIVQHQAIRQLFEYLTRRWFQYSKSMRHISGCRGLSPTGGHQPHVEEMLLSYCRRGASAPGACRKSFRLVATVTERLVAAASMQGESQPGGRLIPTRADASMPAPAASVASNNPFAPPLFCTTMSLATL